MRMLRDINGLNLNIPSRGPPDLDKEKEEHDARSLADANYRLDFFRRYKIDKELKDEQRAKDEQLKSSVRKVTVSQCANVAHERIRDMLASQGPTCHDNTNTAEEEESAVHDATKMWKRPASMPVV